MIQAMPLTIYNIVILWKQFKYIYKNILINFYLDRNTGMLYID